MELFLPHRKVNTAFLFLCLVSSVSQCILLSILLIAGTSYMSCKHKSVCVVLAVVFWQLFLLTVTLWFRWLCRKSLWLKADDSISDQTGFWMPQSIVWAHWHVWTLLQMPWIVLVIMPGYLHGLMSSHLMRPWWPDTAPGSYVDIHWVCCLKHLIHGTLYKDDCCF